MRDIPNRRVGKKVDAGREDRRFVMESQSWLGRSLVVVIECKRCGGYVGLKGKILLSEKFTCPGCGRKGNMDVVRRQMSLGISSEFGG